MYMLSDKIKGKSALKALTFLHERGKDHVHVCLCIYRRKRVQAQIFLKTFIAKCLPKKHSIRLNSSDMVTDI